MKGTLGKDREYQCQVESQIGDAFEPISPWHVHSRIHLLLDRISITVIRYMLMATPAWLTS